ncbi:class I SAM-dependent methyltransferase [Actinomycetes bacterium KLBMP 9759]
MDTEYAASAEYLHLLSKPMWTEMAGRLRAVLRGIDGAAGPVLELGAGTGLGTDVILDTTTNDVLAAEPAPELRAVLLARLADRDEHRVTVLPCGALDVPLPDRLAAVVGMHMVGHLPPDDRHRLWAGLAQRLAPGAPVVLNVQPPATATAVPAWPWSGVEVGGVTYEGTGEAEPTGPGEIRWRMSYRTRRAETVLATARADYRWWPTDAASLANELAEAGIEPTVDGDLVIGRAPVP